MNPVPSSALLRRLASPPLCLLAALAVLAGTPSPVRAETETINGIPWTYGCVIDDSWTCWFNCDWDHLEEGSQIMITSGRFSTPAIPESTSGDIAIPSVLRGIQVAYIGSNAFKDCTKLTSIAIPDGVTSIADEAFAGCSGLTSITLPASVTSIGPKAFSGCSNLRSILVAAGNTCYESRDGILFSKDNDTLVVSPPGRASCAIPDGTKNIGSFAFFENSGLTSLTIPIGVTNIGSYAFSGCGKLTSVQIPDGVMNIGNDAFYDCSGLTSVTIPNSVTNIGSSAFYNCSGLTSVTIPNGVTSIGSSAFCYCSGLTSVTIPDSLTSIGDSAFYGCSELDSVHIHDLTSWHEISFETGTANPLYYAQHLYLNGAAVSGNLIVPDGVTCIRAHAYEGCAWVTSIAIPNSVTGIWANAFAGCNGLGSFDVSPDNSAYSSGNGLLLSKDGKTVLLGVNGAVSIPDGVTCIRDGAFEYCSGLTAISIPNSVTDLGMGTFNGCAGLSSVTIPIGVTCLKVLVFADCSSLTSITIPPRVSCIEDCAFEGCSSLTSITIPKGVTSIGSGVFAHCHELQRILVEADNPVYESRDGAVFTKDGRTLLVVPEAQTSYAVPAGVTKIDGFVFRSNSRLTSVTIPNGVKSIGRFAFSGCTALKAVTIPGSVSSIDMGLFDGCTRLASVTIQSGVKSIGDDAFWGCTSLASVTIPDTVTRIGSDAFACCSGLQSLTIPDSVTSVDWYAFEGSGLKELIVPASWKGTAMLSEAAVPPGCKIVYAVFDYTVKFNANGGELPKGKSMAPQKMTCGKTAKLRKNVFTRKGYVFIGWAKSKTGAVAYKNGAAVKNLRTDGKTLTLYAKWAKESYAVAFDANGGKGKMAAQTIVYGKAANLSKNAFTRKGWLFLGWAKTPGGAVAYKNAASVKNLRKDGKTTTLYAVWEKAQTVKFDANGGTCAVADRDYRVGKAYGTFPTPDWKWRTFLGWFTAADGGDWVAETDVAETATARKLFAHWEYIPVRLGESSKSVGPDAAAKVSVAMSAKKDWTASADASWITVRTKSGSSGSGSLLFDVAKNTGKARTGRIILSADGKAVVLTVTQKARTLSLSAEKKTFKAKAATGQKLGVTATVAWTAKSSAKWLVVKTAKGSGNGTVIYELAANKGAGRAATITVSGGGKKATFRVEQKGQDGSMPVAAIPATTHYLQVDPTRETFDADGMTNGIAEVNSDLAWTASTAADWIELDVDATSGSGTGVLRYRVAENDDGTNRVGKIAVAASGLKTTLTVEQAAKNRELYLCVMPTNRIATASAASETVWVEANVAWTAGSGGDWIDLVKTSGNGSGSLSYSMAANTATTNRTGTITLFGGGLSAVFTLTQEGRSPEAGGTEPPAAKYLRVNPTGREHGDASQTGSFLVEANVAWTVTASANWIIPHTRSGSKNGAVSYSIAKNTGAARTGTITVRGTGVSPATFQVVQRGTTGDSGGETGSGGGGGGGVVVTPTPVPTPAARWIRIPAEVQAPAEGGSMEIHVETRPEDMHWKTWTSQPSWIHLQTESGTGAGAVLFHVDPNPSKSKRTGIITVWSGAYSARCKVVQDGKKPCLSVTPMRFEGISWKGRNGLKVSVYSNVDWSVSANPGIRLHTSGGTGNGTITFDVLKNPDYKERKLILTVSGVGVKSIHIPIFQEKATLLKVSPTSRTFSHEKATGSLSVTANVKWKAVSSDGWISLSKASGNGNGSVVFTISENKTGKARTGTITVTGGGKSVTVTITQNAAPYLKVSPTSLTVPFKAASYELSVTANVSWKATSGATWITLTTTSGKKDGTIGFKVAKNTTGKNRVGTIVVTGGGLTRKATITQKKEPTISLSPAKATVACDSVYSWFYVTANVKWSAKSSADWLRVKSIHVDSTGVRNGGYVEYDVDENTTAKKRTATITVTGGGKSVVFTLTQKGRPNLCFYRPDGWPAAVFVTTAETSLSEQTSFVSGGWPPPCIRYAWANIGGSDTGSFTIKETVIEPDGESHTLTDSHSSLPVNKYDAYFLYYGLSSGSSIYAAPAIPGTYKVTVSLDTGNKVKESDETDNTATVTFTVVSTGSSTSYDAPPAEEFVAVEPEAPVIVEEPAKAGWVAVVASGGEDAGAVADGDEETAWEPDVMEGAWCVLTFPEARDAKSAELVGDNLPEGTRLLFSEDSENWREDLPARVQYVWAVFPASDEPFAVREIRLLSK